jgi:hypothetical protein
VKFLGVPFGIDLDMQDIDSFISNKVTKKMYYWTSIFLCLTTRVVMVNSVLLSTLWFFLTAWSDASLIIHKIKS